MELPLSSIFSLWYSWNSTRYGYAMSQTLKVPIVPFPIVLITLYTDLLQEIQPSSLIWCVYVPMYSGCICWGPMLWQNLLERTIQTSYPFSKGVRSLTQRTDNTLGITMAQPCFRKSFMWISLHLCLYLSPATTANHTDCFAHIHYHLCT